MYQNPAYPDEGRVWERYVEYLHNQVRELCTNYGKIDILWFVQLRRIQENGEQPGWSI